MFEPKIDPSDLAILLERWQEDSRRIPWKGEDTEEIKARLSRLENLGENVVLALSGQLLPR